MEPTVNTKFIANPSFGVESVGGQALTLTIENRKNGNDFVGYKCVFFDRMLYKDFEQGLVGVSPGVQFTDPSSGNVIGSTLFFLGFVYANPIHVTKMNVRATKSGTLPDSIEILTPNIFSGQMNRQIINVTADSNMYQNQSNIVTLKCDAYLCRESIVVFNKTFAESVAQPLNIDISFDKYLSLEKALVENYTVLTTSVGMSAAINEEVANINAQAAEKIPVMMTAQAPSMTEGGALISRQPAVTKGSGSPYISVQPLFTRGDNI